jgi:hypothetical protein
MRNGFYREFNRDMLWNMELRKILNTDMFETKDELFTEYSILSSGAKRLPLPLFYEVGLDEELAFYLNLDMLTYLPFDKLGYDFLNSKLENSSVAEFKYNIITQIIRKKYPELEDEIKENIKTFLNNYYHDIFEVNVINLAIITLRMFHRYVTIMNFGGPLAMMTIQNEIGKKLKRLKNDIKENDLKEININDYLPEFDFDNNELSSEMVEYIVLCLERVI